MITDEGFDLPPELLKELVHNLLSEFPEMEQKEIKAIGEEWATKQDAGVWWKCPAVWKKIAGAKKRKRGASAVVDIFEKKKSEKEDSVYRIDFLKMPEVDGYMEEKFKRTPEGYLKGRAIVTNVGVFPYVMPDGSMRYELRPPEEVFDIESTDTLKQLPLANEHPSKGSIDIDNIKDVQVGFTGDDVRKDEYHLSVALTWTDADTIEDINGGKRGLSAGYRADLDPTPGVWMGVAYDAIQRNIRYNHIVVTDVGRAGDDARIKMDSANAYGIQKIYEEGVKSIMKKIRIDGVEYEAEAPVIAAYTQLQNENEELKKDSSTKLDTLKADTNKVEAERDQLKEENETLKADAKKSKDSSPKEVEKAVQNRMVILDAARRSETEVKEDMKENDIKKAVVLTLFPNSKEKMDSADEAYIQARFDMALEKLDEVDDDKNDSATELKGDTINKTDVNKKDSKSAYNDMVKRDQEAWKTDSKEVN